MDDRQVRCHGKSLGDAPIALAKYVASEFTKHVGKARHDEAALPNCSVSATVEYGIDHHFSRFVDVFDHGCPGLHRISVFKGRQDLFVMFDIGTHPM